MWKLLSNRLVNNHTHMTPYILIMFLATSIGVQSGTGGISPEFASKATCEAAGIAIAQDAVNRNIRVLTWGCFQK